MASASRNRLRSAVLPTLAAVVVTGALSLSQSKAAVTYINPNGTAANWGVSASPGTVWEDQAWSTTNSSTAAAVNWVSGTAAGFAATTPTAYTVYVGATETVAGFFQSGTGVSTTVSQQASTTGNINLVTGLQGCSISSGSGNLFINAPISGAGGLQQQGSGQVYLYGNNSFLGGFQTTGGQVTNYNNANSFGTGSISFTGTSGQGLINNNTTGTSFTVANAVTFLAAGNSINFVSGSNGGTPGTNFSGAVTLTSTGSVNMQAGNAATDITQFSGIISGAGSINIKGSGAIIFSGANAYTGQTTVSAGILKLGATNTISHTASLVMGGGKVDPGGFKQAYGTLKLTANSVLDYISGDAEQDFTGSSAVVWTASTVLNLANFDDLSPSSTLLRVGTTSGGLSLAQLAQIEFNGDATTLGPKITSAGYVYLPEPTSITAILLGAPALLARRRRA